MPCARLKLCTFAISAVTWAAAAWTSTLKLPLTLLPAASAAVQVTVVVPIGNVLPDGREQFTVTAPFTMSVADPL